jgi:hypothetical protein
VSSPAALMTHHVQQQGMAEALPLLLLLVLS